MGDMTVTEECITWISTPHDRFEKHVFITQETTSSAIQLYQGAGVQSRDEDTRQGDGRSISAVSIVVQPFPQKNASDSSKWRIICS
jgi:hypothetical protein